MAAVAAQKPAGKANLIVTIAALTVLAAVGGGIVGKLIVAKLQVAKPAVEAPKPATPYAGDTVVRELPASVTNLADPPDMRLRIQVAIVFDKKGIENPSLMAAQISDDLVAFVKTLTLSEMQGASGMQNLREDLNERAAVRSQGKVREVIIETLVVQ
jgi:flagellar FliL protein